MLDSGDIEEYLPAGSRSCPHGASRPLDFQNNDVHYRILESPLNLDRIEWAWGV